jgi:hypothetical protein
MGIYLDTVEDNDESLGWKVEARRQLLGIPQPPPRNLPSVKCPRCGLLFLKTSDLDDHIFVEHRHEQTGRRCYVYAESSHQKKLDIDPSQLIPIDEEMALLQLRIDKNDRRIEDEWHVYQPRLDESSQGQYLSGILEYLRAHDLEVNRCSTDFKSLSEHFNRAYRKLRPFRTLMAQQICQTIALKMSWFKEYTETPESSLFCLAFHFFTHSYEEVAKIDNLIVASNRRKQGVILDGFHSEFLEVMKFYYSDRLALNHNWICKLELLLSGVSNECCAGKLALFKARLYRDWQEVNRAKESYYVIRNHHEFGLEAREFNG